MKKQPKKLLIYATIVLVFLWFLSAFYPPVSDKSIAYFKQQCVPGSLLEYGTIGKVMKEIGVITPIDKRGGIATNQNINDLLKRAREDREKWIRDDEYRKFEDTGLFVYVELQDLKADTNFTISYENAAKCWVRKVFSIAKTRKSLSFFLDIAANKSPVFWIAFLTAVKHVDVRSIVFLQKGFEPVLIYDPISYRRFLEHISPDEYHISSTFFRLSANKTDRVYKVKPLFRLKGNGEISKIQKKRGGSNVQLVTKRHNPILNTLALSERQIKKISCNKIPVLSIDTTKESLYSKQNGIVKNSTKHGKEWECAAYIRFAKDGKIVLNTFAGLRLQGGNPGRVKGLINFRLFFRKMYGISSIESRKIFHGTKGLLKRIAVKQSEWKKWPLNSPIGYDITNRLGGLAPPTLPLLLYLNGKSLGLYYFVPHLGEKQISLIFPDRKLKYYRWRGAIHPSAYNFITRDFWIKLRSLEKTGQLNEMSVKRHFDLDHLIANVFAIIFSGTGDFVQGLILKGIHPEDKMFWYQWDMDHSFLNIPEDIEDEYWYKWDVKHGNMEPPLRKNNVIKRWHKNPSVHYLFTKKERWPRIRLLQVLIDNDPAFKKKILRTMLFMLNHRLTDEYLTDILRKYKDILHAIDYPDGDLYIARLAEFFKKRKEFLVKEMNNLNVLPPIKSCVVSSEYSFMINGFQKNKRYIGYHTIGETLSIKIDDFEQVIFVNGKEKISPYISFVVEDNKPCRIKVKSSFEK